MWLWGYTPKVFFIHQLFVAGFEVGGLFLESRLLLPKKRLLDQPVGWSFRPVKPTLKFALTIAFTSSVWVLVTQTDKLVLSGILPLAEYGYFTLGVLVASGIVVISSPISSAIMPRMTRMYAEERHAELIQVYRQATQWVSLIAGSVAVTLVICAEPLLFAWSGNADLSTKAAPIMKLYAVGNGLLAIAAFPYYLQYARGDLRYHLIGNAVMVVTLIPTIIYAASRYGGVGAGWVWLGVNGLYLFTWLAYVHHKLEPGLHWKWLRQDVVEVLLPSVILGLLVACISIQLATRIEMLIYSLAVGALILTATVLFNRTLRNKILKYG
jgi:O-antigen/teichoic acid export membrane protein